MTDKELQLLVDDFLVRHRMSASTFGRWALDDSRFVFDLRRGRTCLNRTMRRVMIFMRDYDAKRGNRNILVSPPSVSMVRQEAESEECRSAFCLHCPWRKQ